MLKDKDVFEKYGITAEQRTKFANERGWGIREAYNPSFNTIIEKFFTKNPNNGLDIRSNDGYLFISNHDESQCYLETCKPALFYPIFDYHLNNAQNKIKTFKMKVFDYLCLLNQHIVFDYVNIHNIKRFSQYNSFSENNYESHLSLSENFRTLYDINNYIHSYTNTSEFTLDDWDLAPYDDIMKFSFNFDGKPNDYTVTISDEYNIYAYREYKIKKNIRTFLIDIDLKNSDDFFIKLLNQHLMELSNLLGFYITEATQQHIDLIDMMIYGR